jgi:hypothetical protein
MSVFHPFNTGYSPLSYSGNPWANVPHREGCLYTRIQPLQYWLFTPELQWQSRGKRRTSQGGVRVYRGVYYRRMTSCRQG